MISDRGILKSKMQLKHCFTEKKVLLRISKGEE